MNDSFYELIIPRKADIKDIVSVVFISATIILLTFVGFSFFSYFSSIFLIAGVSTIYFFVLPRLRKEYEYYLLNYTLEITLIVNKSKRKNIMEFDIRKADIVAPTNSSKLSAYRPTKTLDFSSGNKTNNTFSLIIAIEKDLYHIILEPDKIMLDQMKLWMGQKMYL